MREKFNFHAALEEIAEGGSTVWGVWVGEHGFLTAVFTHKDEAEAYNKERGGELLPIDLG